MKELDKKIKKKIYLALILVGIELLTMAILYIITCTVHPLPAIRVCSESGPIMCEQHFITLDIYDSLFFVFIINLVLGIYLIYKGVKIKKGIILFVGILSFIPIPTWLFIYPQMLEMVTPNMTWDKPILYLYPEKEKKVTVTFEHPENLLTTYPKYETKWKVTATPEGNLYDESGQYYYALYWDEKNTTPEAFKEGFYVTKDNAIEFLETTLTQIGLTRREQNEFIMYWLPILEENGQSIVSYTLTEERQKENKLIITPKPDSLLRVAINIKKVDKKVKIKEQKLPHFTRTGFTAVEWGGSIYE